MSHKDTVIVSINYKFAGKMLVVEILNFFTSVWGSKTEILYFFLIFYVMLVLRYEGCLWRCEERLNSWLKLVTVKCSTFTTKIINYLNYPPLEI